MTARATASGSDLAESTQQQGRALAAPALLEA